MTHEGPAPEWKFFLVPPGEYTIRDTWFTAGMRGTGSKTIVVDNAFVPESRILRLTESARRQDPGRRRYSGVIFHTPFFYYAPISFATPMLGAAQGAYEMFRETGPKRGKRRTAGRLPNSRRSRCGWRGRRPTSTRPSCYCAARWL